VDFKCVQKVISVSHGSSYDHYSFFGCDAVQNDEDGDSRILRNTGKDLPD
jgi:hypothetical protein